MISLDGQLRVAPNRASLSSGLNIPHVLNLDGLVFQEAGTYSFEVSVDGTHQVSLPLRVEGGAAEME